MIFMTLDHIMELQQRYYVNVNALMSQTRAMMVEAEAKTMRLSRGTWFKAEARPRQRAAETETGNTLPRGLHHWYLLVAQMELGLKF